MCQFVEAFREQLTHAEGDFRKFASEMAACCADCNEYLYY
jgi:hypothetical protein